MVYKVERNTNFEEKWSLLFAMIHKSYKCMKKEETTASDVPYEITI
ncbi:hypothetical protein [Aquimarina pacifica]|nr:hypothetical protein [Aquimarina pacifica]